MIHCTVNKKVFIIFHHIFLVNSFPIKGVKAMGTSTDPLFQSTEISSSGGPSPSALAVWSAMGSVYLIWGSTYLAIRIAIETLPPFLMAATRFLIAGGILY